MTKKSNKEDGYWNYRVVAVLEDNLLTGQEYFYSIRDVYYKNDIPYAWGADPQFPMGETAKDVFEDMEQMSKAMYAPLLVEVKIRNKTKLVAHPKKSAYHAKADYVKPPKMYSKKKQAEIQKKINAKRNKKDLGLPSNN